MIITSRISGRVRCNQNPIRTPQTGCSGPVWTIGIGSQIPGLEGQGQLLDLKKTSKSCWSKCQGIIL